LLARAQPEQPASQRESCRGECIRVECSFWLASGWLTAVAHASPPQATSPASCHPIKSLQPSSIRWPSCCRRGCAQYRQPTREDSLASTVGCPAAVRLVVLELSLSLSLGSS
ncbi:hypothetical protein GOP47_0017213, partial [Adiantum capillus-veneris]